MEGKFSFVSQEVASLFFLVVSILCRSVNSCVKVETQIPGISFYSFFFSLLKPFLSAYLAFYVSIPAHPSIPSYTVKYTIAAGTLFIKCGVNPPYNPAIPSSLKTVMKHRINPLYFLL